MDRPTPETPGASHSVVHPFPQDRSLLPVAAELIRELREDAELNHADQREALMIRQLAVWLERWRHRDAGRPTTAETPGVSAFTPGPDDCTPLPWHVSGCCLFASNGVRVAEIPHDEQTIRYVRDAANCLPDLYAALHDIEQHTAPLVQAGDPLGLTIRRIARAALAHAEGKDA